MHVSRYKFYVLKTAYYIRVYEQVVEVKYLGLAINGMNLQAIRIV